MESEGPNSIFIIHMFDDKWETEPISERVFEERALQAVLQSTLPKKKILGNEVWQNALH